MVHTLTIFEPICPMVQNISKTKEWTIIIINQLHNSIVNNNNNKEKNIILVNSTTSCEKSFGFVSRRVSGRLGY